jgi:hypothetical protein
MPVFQKWDPFAGKEQTGNLIFKLAVNEPGTAQILLFLVGDVTLEQTTCGDYLKKKIPDYMLPAKSFRAIYEQTV